MREGIAIVGLNGSGKSTLAHALAKELGYFEIDCEDYYFPEQRESRQSALEENYDVQCNYLGDLPYSVARSKSEVEQAIAKDIILHPQYVISGVTMNWNKDILSTIKVVFWLKTEAKERVKRVKCREEKRWGSRVSVGGDMYEQQLSFRNLISGLPESKVEDSISKIGCEVIELDGMLPVSRNLANIQEYLRKLYKMYLYHYFDKRTGPFKSLTAISEEEARKVLRQIKADRPNSQCASRDAAYVKKRQNCEAILRREFAAKGGIMEIESPHYMVVEHSPWLSTWYEQPDFLKIPIEEFDVRKLSFTYGDSMPTFSPRVKDGKEYRQKVYTYEEILKVIEKYGLPQEWNDDGAHGPERYIEVHVWGDETIRKYTQRILYLKRTM